MAGRTEEGDMSWEDRQACSDVIVRWGLYRDQGRWDELLDTFHPGALIHISWFTGRAIDFVAESRKSFDPTRTRMVLKHLIWPSAVDVKGDRAVAETSAAIVVRARFGDFHADNTSYARFHDRLRKSDCGWRIVERTAIYEFDRYDAVDSPDKLAAYLRANDCSTVPAAYRYIGHRIQQMGRSLAPNVHVDGSEEVEKLYAAGRAWLAGDA
jgi:hypothetical protein